MPELPEVETVIRILRKKVIGRTIVDVKVFFSNIVKTHETDEFIEILKGKKIDDIDRVAKHIVFILQDYALISHLRMEGKYFVTKNYDHIDRKHVLLEMTLDNGEMILYHDTRRFGTYHLQKIDTYKDINPIHKVATEAWDIDYNDLYKIISKRNRKIKALLLDQTIVSGLGNIYVDEVLWFSKIHPFTRGNKITLQQCKDICENSTKILRKAVEMGGTTISSYTSSLGVSGTYQNELKVHQQIGKQCERCGTTIEKTKTDGRGTYYCPKCQVEVI